MPYRQAVPPDTSFPRPHFLTNEVVSTTRGRAISLNHVTPVVNDVLLSVTIRQLASLTTNAKASSAMKQIGETIVMTASARMFDDYCGTVVKCDTGAASESDRDGSRRIVTPTPADEPHETPGASWAFSFDRARSAIHSFACAM
jgi:hypothetical protein